MIDTTILALIATPIAGVLGMLVAWLVVVRLKASAGLMDFLGMLGLSVPGTVLGIGYLITFNKPVIFGHLMFMPALAVRKRGLRRSHCHHHGIHRTLHAVRSAIRYRKPSTGGQIHRRGINIPGRLRPSDLHQGDDASH